MFPQNFAGYKNYLSYRGLLCFWISLAFILAFFMFSWVESGNIFILFFKILTTLLFVFLVPGYVITKIFYPGKNEICSIERFALSVAFSLTFIMFTCYILDRIWVISHFSLRLSTFFLILFFILVGIWRVHNHYTKTKITVELKTHRKILPLIFLTILAFILNAYDPVTSPVIGYGDPYTWTRIVSDVIREGHLDNHMFHRGYPAGFPFIVTFLTIFSDARAYEVMRYLPVFPFLNVIPVYLLAYYIFKKEYPALLAGVLLISTWFLFHNASSLAVPRMMIHFFLILLLFMLLKTLENPSFKNSLATSLLLSSNILLYHYEITILIIFIPVIFLLGCAHSWRQKNIDKQKILESALIIGMFSTLISGFLWYFWKLKTIISNYSSKTGYYFAGQKVYPETFMYVKYEGWLLITFSIIGLISIFLRPKHFKNIRYQFLVTYLIAILFIIEIIPQFITMGPWTSIYIFAYLTLPLSILAAWGVYAILTQFLKTKVRNKIFPLAVVLLFIFNISSLNYSYSSAGVHELNRQVKQGNYESLFFF